MLICTNNIFGERIFYCTGVAPGDLTVKEICFETNKYVMFNLISDTRSQKTEDGNFKFENKYITCYMHYKKNMDNTYNAIKTLKKWEKVIVTGKVKQQQVTKEETEEIVFYDKYYVETILFPERMASLINNMSYEETAKTIDATKFSDKKRNEIKEQINDDEEYLFS